VPARAWAQEPGPPGPALSEQSEQFEERSSQGWRRRSQQPRCGAASCGAWTWTSERLTWCEWPACWQLNMREMRVW
jgi:hypothetical protein